MKMGEAATRNLVASEYIMIPIIEMFDRMRSGLASTLEERTEEPTMQTMKEVCRPMGMHAIQLRKE